CGAVIQQIAVSVTSTASPLAAAASAAMTPVTTSGRVGRGCALPPSRPSLPPDAADPARPSGSGASGASAETLTPRSSQRSAPRPGRRAAVNSTAGGACWHQDRSSVLVAVTTKTDGRSAAGARARINGGSGGSSPGLEQPADQG